MIIDGHSTKSEINLLGVAKRRNLSHQGSRKAKALTYFTPIGGGVKFGERGSEAVVREFKEEIGGTIQEVRFLGMLENLFTLEGKPKHEIVLVYEGWLMESTFYEREVIQGEDTGSPFKAVWKPLSLFHATDTPLYPEGLLELVGRFHKNDFQVK